MDYWCQGSLEDYENKELLLFMDSEASAGAARAKAVIGWNKQTNKIIGGTGEIPKGYDYWLVKFDALHTF